MPGPTGTTMKPAGANPPLIVVGLCMVVAPLAVGSVHQPVALAISGFALLGLPFVALRRGEMSGCAGWLLAVMTLGVGASALQLLPLPPDLVAWLSPETDTIHRAAGLSGWLPLSLSPTATSLALVQHLGLAALFLQALTLARQRQRARILLAILLGMGAVEGLIALVQAGLDSESILGLYKSSGGVTPTGTFVNENHAAGFWAMASAPGLAFALRGSDRVRFAAGSAALIGVTILLVSGSRGGLVGVLAGVLLSFTLWRGQESPRRSKPLVIVLTSATLVALCVVNWDAIELFHSRVPFAEDGKVTVWRDAGRMALAFPATGVGRGAFQEVAPRFESFRHWIHVSHPESWPLQLATEWGLFISILIVAGIGWAAIRRWQAEPLDSSGAAAAAGLTAIGVQNLFDFNLEFAGCAAPAAILLGIFATRRRSTRRGPSTRKPAVALLACGTLALVGHLGWGAQQTLEALDARMPTLSLPELDAAIALHPADYRLHQVRGARHQATAPHLALLDYARATHFDPHHPGPHHAQAILLREQGLNLGAALEYRAALELRFNAKLLREVVQAFGNNPNLFPVALPPGKQWRDRARRAADQLGMSQLAGDPENAKKAPSPAPSRPH